MGIFLYRACNTQTFASVKHRIECTEISFSSVKLLVFVAEAKDSLWDRHLCRGKRRLSFCSNEKSVPSNVLNEYQVSELNFLK